MNSTYARSLPAERTRRNRPAQVISLLGPSTVAAGVIWAIVQPYRVTLLHPLRQGFWWLLVEPPLLVMAVGVLYALLVARPLLAELEERDAASR